MTALLALHAPFLAQLEDEVVTDGTAIFEGVLISVIVLIAANFIGKAVATRKTGTGCRP